jgi:hypothetical protein
MQTSRIMVCIQRCSVFQLRILISIQINEEVVKLQPFKDTR